MMAKIRRESHRDETVEALPQPHRKAIAEFLQQAPAEQNCQHPAFKPGEPITDFSMVPVKRNPAYKHPEAPKESEE